MLLERGENEVEKDGVSPRIIELQFFEELRDRLPSTREHIIEEAPIFV